MNNFLYLQQNSDFLGGSSALFILYCVIKIINIPSDCFKVLLVYIMWQN